MGRVHNSPIPRSNSILAEVGHINFDEHIPWEIVLGDDIDVTIGDVHDGESGSGTRTVDRESLEWLLESIINDEDTFWRLASREPLSPEALDGFSFFDVSVLEEAGLPVE